MHTINMLMIPLYNSTLLGCNIVSLFIICLKLFNKTQFDFLFKFLKTKYAWSLALLRFWKTFRIIISLFLFVFNEPFDWSFYFLKPATRKLFILDTIYSFQFIYSIIFQNGSIIFFNYFPENMKHLIRTSNYSYCPITEKRKVWIKDRFS